MTQENKQKRNITISLEPEDWENLMRDYDAHNDGDPSYSFDDYLSDILSEEAEHIGGTGHGRSAYYCFCDDKDCKFSIATVREQKRKT